MTFERDLEDEEISAREKRRKKRALYCRRENRKAQSYNTVRFKERWNIKCFIHYVVSSGEIITL